MRRAATLMVLVIAGPGTAGDAPPGALACSGCHGASAELSLAPLSAAEITDAMLAFQSEDREATIMNRIAAGFDTAEIAAIAAWIVESR